MEKTKYYSNARFPPKVVRQAHERFISLLDSGKELGLPKPLQLTMEDETWSLDTLDEFLADCPRADEFNLYHMTKQSQLIVSYSRISKSCVVVSLPSRDKIQAVFQVFEDNLESSKIPEEPELIKIFIGHGGDQQWRDLKDHLHEQHGFDVVAYEIGPRAGLSVKEVLEQMLTKSSFAVLVLTGEDQGTDGELHARENVIHELGLFQGRLGFMRAIPLLEGGLKEFSNILGINQIRFSKGNIRETFGDVLAKINEEFKNAES